MSGVNFIERSKKILISLVFLAAFFPYISPTHTPFDTQPWALVFAGILILILISTERRKFFTAIPKPLVILVATLVYAVSTFVLHVLTKNVDYLAGVRSLWDYLSLIVLTYFGYRFWPNASAKLFFGAIGVWLLAEMAQLIFGLRVVAAFLPRFASGGGRGFTSLAPEPAFYAAICVYLLVLNEFFFAEKKYSSVWYFASVFAILLQIIFSYSGIGIAMVTLFVIGKLLELLLVKNDSKQKKRQLAVIVLCLAAVGIFFYPNKHVTATRAGALVQTAVSQPQALKKDPSVSGRVMNPFIAFNVGISLRQH